jgi:hypothetical protein
MTIARQRAPILIALVLLAVAVLGIALNAPRSNKVGPRPAADRPTLMLLTSLPLVFGEGFDLASTGSPALKALQSRYRVVPISVSSGHELARGRLLLMAHPRAQPAEDLVALDAWVRAGGRILLLADPMLEWPSERRLGDPLRPAPMFMDTGLLGHWGLLLDAPDRRGPEKRSLAGYRIVTVSPGRLSGKCRITDDALLADCRLGRGRAVIVADADFLDAGELGPDARHNLDALLSQLALIEPK